MSHLQRYRLALHSGGTGYCVCVEYVNDMDKKHRLFMFVKREKGCWRLSRTSTLKSQIKPGGAV